MHKPCVFQHLLFNAHSAPLLLETLTVSCVQALIPSRKGSWLPKNFDPYLPRRKDLLQKDPVPQFYSLPSGITRGQNTNVL